MVRGIHKLTERACAHFIKTCIRAGKRGVLNDGGSLYLNVGAGGTASWIFRYQQNGKRHDMGLGATHILGAVHTLGLAEAREAAHLARQQLHRGEDPLTIKRRGERARRSANSPSRTFRYCAAEYIKLNEAGWGAASRREWENSLTTYAAPIIGDKLVSDIVKEDILAVLKPIWKSKTEAMIRLHRRIEAILGWAIAKEFRAAANPALWKDNLDADLSKKDRPAKMHLAALDYHEVPALIADLEADPRLDATALRFDYYTVLRSGEIEQLEWSHVDFANQSLLLPAAVMKMERDFKVPLTPPALAILEALAAVRTASPYVFAGRRGGSLSQKAMRQALKRHRPEAAATVHGSTRAAFSTWRADETQFLPEVAEACLAHSKGDKVAEAYNRGDLFNKRRELMLAWALFCCGGNVVTLRRSA
jgi:integrase